MPTVQTRPLSVQDYHSMIEAGIFRPDERIELLSGQLIQMAAKGSPHRAAVTRARRILEQLLGSRVLVCIQDPVQLDDFSEPEPDIAVVKPDPLDYETHHPSVADIFWLFEVSDSTLAYDCGAKALAYARAGIQEYWVLDIKRRRLHLFRQPGELGYGDRTILAEDAMISPISFLDCVIAISAFLKPLDG
jgi:Uma2 family endonuclease